MSDYPIVEIDVFCLKISGHLSVKIETITITRLAGFMIPEVERFESCIGQHLKIDDWQALEIILATVVAHKLHGEMLWLRIIGASGSGKTEILRTLLAQRELYQGFIETMETLTPSAIRRGLQLMKKDKETGELKKIKVEPTLLERLDGKLVITKELAPLLTRHHDARNEIFGLLRSVHDGELDADYGSMQGHIKQKCWFDWILGTTTYIDQQQTLDQQLGSRFTDIRWGSPILRKEAVIKAVNNVNLLDTIRKELGALMTSIIAHTDNKEADRFCVEEWFLDLVDIVSILRTPVERDGYSKEIKQPPSTELGTRIGQNFSKVCKGLYMLGIEDTQSYMTRLALDAIPPNRRIVLKAIHTLESEGHKVTQEAISNMNGTGLSQQYISIIMKDIELAGAKDIPWRQYLFTTNLSK